MSQLALIALTTIKILAILHIRRERENKLGDVEHNERAARAMNSADGKKRKKGSGKKKARQAAASQL